MPNPAKPKIRNPVKPNFEWIHPYAESKRGKMPNVPLAVIDALSGACDAVALVGGLNVRVYRVHVGRWVPVGGKKGDKKMVCLRMRWRVPSKGKMKRIIFKDRKHFRIMGGVSDYDS